MDTELVVRAQGGDQAAFASLARAAYGRLHRVAQNILSDFQLAEDATQQALLEMWRSLPRLRDPDRFEAWSYRIAVHACYAEARRANRWMPALAPDGEHDPASERAISGVMYRDQLERGFRRLSVEQRAVLVLHHYLDLPLDEVARILAIPPGTAHSRLSRAMSAMRASLEADGRLRDADVSLEKVR